MDLTRSIGGGDQFDMTHVMGVGDATLKTYLDAKMVDTNDEVFGRVLLKLTGSNNYEFTLAANAEDFDAILNKPFYDNIALKYKLDVNLISYTGQDGVRRTANRIMNIPVSRTPSLGDSLMVAHASSIRVGVGGSTSVGYVIGTGYLNDPLSSTTESCDIIV